MSRSGGPRSRHSRRSRLTLKNRQPDGKCIVTIGLPDAARPCDVDCQKPTEGRLVAFALERITLYSDSDALAKPNLWQKRVCGLRRTCKRRPARLPPRFGGRPAYEWTLRSGRRSAGKLTAPAPHASLYVRPERLVAIRCESRHGSLGDAVLDHRLSRRFFRRPTGLSQHHSILLHRPEYRCLSLNQLERLCQPDRPRDAGNVDEFKRRSGR